ncbi:MAG: chitobiase/beta-hexosaminidase C-terminal domain-containing protein [Bacteroidales bacterium]|nr:chitobiase/beta-hexosaminidase C-terminal domain-containing protein [Candidatus Colimorpha merdihippi]
MKRLSLPLFLLLCINTVVAQQLEGIDNLRMAPRANIISYDDPNDVERLRYDDSPYYLSFDPYCASKENSDWQISFENNHVSMEQQYLFPKDWKGMRIFFRMRVPAGYGFFIDNRLIGISHDGSSTTEFDISEQIRMGKASLLSVRYVSDDQGAMLESYPDVQQQPDYMPCALLLKPQINVQDYTITTSFDPTSQSGSYSIEADLFNGKKKGRCYLEVELWDNKGHQADKLGVWCFFDKRSETSHTITSTLSKVTPWNAEVPRLYTAVIRLYDDNMELQDIVGTRFGFHTISDRNSIRLNDQIITFKGILLDAMRLDTPEKVKMLRNQMVMMKCNNINAIRLQGKEPISEKFFELCDELGFYVICDATLSPASSMGMAVAADAEYSDLFAKRMQSMYGQHKNHPCILAWSLGNCTDNGTCMQTAYHTLRQLDGQRPVLYSGALYSDNTDLIVPVQCTPSMLSQYVSKSTNRSLVMNSFGSSKGNSFGGMNELWQKVIDHKSIQGGFFNAGNWNELSTRPYLADLKQMYRPFDISLISVSDDAAEFIITNLSDFRTLADFKLDYVICTNLKSDVVAGDVALALKPGESKELKLKVPSLLLYAGEELYIRFTLRQRNNTPTIPKNTVLYTAQYPLPASHMPCQQYSIGEHDKSFAIEKDSALQTKIYNNNVSIIFNDSLGLITSLNYRGQEILSSSPKLNFMRPPSPNDFADPNGYKQWQCYEHGNMKCEVVATNCRALGTHSVGIDVMMRYYSDRHGLLYDVRQTYLILSSGDILISNDITPSEKIKTMARVGIQLGVTGAFDTVQWLGLNNESYCDRNQSGLISQYIRPADQMTYHYPQFQHAGNFDQTRWMSVYHGSTGLYADIIDTLCGFSIYPYHDFPFTQDWDQHPTTEGYTLNIDYKMAGVGSAQGGIMTEDKHLVKDNKINFTLHLRPYDCSEYNAQDFRRIIYPKVISNIVEIPTITKNRDRFDGPMQIILSCTTPKAEIHYSLDGSLPTEKSPLYTKPITIQNSCIVKARAFKKGEAPSFVATEQYSFDYITECAFRHKPNTPYNKNASKALFDGEIGDVNDLSRGWLGFSGHDVQIDLQLGKAISISNVTLRFAHVPDAWVFAPQEVLVSVSTDGKTFSNPIPATISYDPASEQLNTSQLQVVSVEINQSEIQFVRILAKPISRIPQWHRAKGLKPWIMMDEIEISEVLNKQSSSTNQIQ